MAKTETIKKPIANSFADNVVSSGLRGMVLGGLARQHSETMALAVLFFPFSTVDANYNFPIETIAFEGIGSFPVTGVHYKDTNFIVLYVDNSGTPGEIFICRQGVTISY